MNDELNTNQGETLKELTDELSADTDTENDVSSPTQAPKPVEAIPIDISKLTEEQLQMLKARLSTTPDQITRKEVKKPVIFLRETEGKLIIDIKRAFLKVMRDLETRSDVERHCIPVLLEGETEFKDMIYSDFINLTTRVPFEVKQVIQEPVRIEEGTTVSRETGLPVIMERTELVTKFVVTRNGKDLIIKGNMANA